MEMHCILDRDAVDRKGIDPSRWTVVVPAAGRGSRLGYHQPKILYPLLGRPILDWLLDAVRATASRFVFVLSPEGRPQIEPYLRETLDRAASVVVQEEPTGMGDAVLLAEPRVATEHTLVVWGDQVLLTRTTVEACAAAHQARPAASLTLATVIKRDPYIHFERDAEQRITRVLQARENEIDVECGESDCGLFLFSTQSLFPTLAAVRRDPSSIGASTGEFNLLQTLPHFETGAGSAMTVRIPDPLETTGVNTPEEARIAERELEKRRAQAAGQSGGQDSL